MPGLGGAAKFAGLRWRCHPDGQPEVGGELLRSAAQWGQDRQVLTMN